MAVREEGEGSLVNFLDAFISKIRAKVGQIHRASWLLDTTGSEDASQLKISLEVELQNILGDPLHLKQLARWEKEDRVGEPLLERQLDLLVRKCTPYRADPSLLEQIAKEEGAVALIYSNFRSTLEGESFSENDIKVRLKREGQPERRKKVWEASKQIGPVLAPHILKLVALRNQMARSLGYSDYFSMQLALHEVEEGWLWEALDSFKERSEAEYRKVFAEIQDGLARRWKVSSSEVGPWAWSDPFCQEDPLEGGELDALVKELPFLEVAERSYRSMGMDVTKVIDRGDHVERAGKNQHAFCIHMDQEGDVRILNNIKPTIRWLDTVLHELGHAIYELSYGERLPWLLREPPHMLVTEAIALWAGRQAYRPDFLKLHLGSSICEGASQLEKSQRRRQFIFSRWALVMTYFERELYRNPDRDLNRLWWELVLSLQHISSRGSTHGCDWATKCHIALSPVYYFSYLLGEWLASALAQKVSPFFSPQTGAFLREQIFKWGNTLPWQALTCQVLAAPLTAEAWLKEWTCVEGQ